MMVRACMCDVSHLFKFGNLECKDRRIFIKNKHQDPVEEEIN